MKRFRLDLFILIFYSVSYYKIKETVYYFTDNDLTRRRVEYQPRFQYTQSIDPLKLSLCFRYRQITRSRTIAARRTVIYIFICSFNTLIVKLRWLTKNCPNNVQPVTRKYEGWCSLENCVRLHFCIANKFRQFQK